jgi:putative ABC transport system permease protein
MISLMEDVRFGLRLLRRNPGFTAAAVLTLALGISANTVVFNVVYAAIVRPLHFPDAGRLMAILSTAPGVSQPFPSAPGVFVDWRDRTTSFDAVAGVHARRMVLSGVEQPQFVSVAGASSDFLPLIGVQPQPGRTFSKDEDQPGKNNVALVDAGFLEREFGGNASVLGRTIVLNDQPYRIIGVLPPIVRFGSLGTADFWIPLAADREARSGGDIVVAGRLRRGVTRDAAQAEMEAIMRQIGREHIQDSHTGVAVVPLRDWVVAGAGRVLLMLLGAVVLVLLICCANVANLLLARATTRQREMAIRSSLGAGRFRLVRQMFLESALLASIGGALGLGLAILSMRALPAIRAFEIPRVDEITAGPAALAIAAAVTLASAILFGLAPALLTGRGDLHVAMRQGGMSLRTTGGGPRMRDLLVVAQLALALVLLSGAGLMANSLIRLLHIDLGFDRSSVTTIENSLPYKKYDRKRSVEFQRRLAAEVRRMPGVEEVSAADFVALEAVLFPYELRAGAGGALRQCEAQARNVDPRYLRVMGIPLLAGRDFTLADDTRQPVPALIDRTTARLLFGPADPIGQHLRTNYRDRKSLEVIGVVGAARQNGLTAEPGPQLYLPLNNGNARFVIARTSRNASNLAPAIRAAVRVLDPELPAPEIDTMSAVYQRATATPRFHFTVLGVFAMASLILAATGIYGVTAYTVAQRTHEFGVRIALGAQPGDILRLVLAGGLRTLSCGTALGLAGSLTAGRILSTLLYGVRPGDPLTLVCVSALLAGISLFACYTAARRATTVDPGAALRCE